MDKIVVLDGFTLNPGDMSWDAFEGLGKLCVYERTDENCIVERAQDATYILTNKTPITAKTLDRLPSLKYIGVLATGFNVVDVQAAAERGITVTNIPTYGTRSVAQMVFAHLLHLTQHVAEHAQGVAKGKWQTCPDFCYWEYPLIELEGKTLGLVGYGRIGKATAQIARSFGMNVMSYDPFISAPDVETGVDFVDLDTLLSSSDVISLHCPLTEQNREFLNKEKISIMKQGSFLINTSRGPLVCEQDLADALNSGHIAGAGLDVVSTEPIKANNPLLTAKNCYITPHISWATESARKRLMALAVDNLKAFMEGKPKNIVS
nr:D-2-hydroxyacid dehydrogenase [uncultured Sphaerochaeta sp.]